MNVKMVSVLSVEIILKLQKCKEIILHLGVKEVKQLLKIVKCYVMTAIVAKVTISVTLLFRSNLSEIPTSCLGW